MCGKDATAVMALLHALLSQRPRRIDIAFADAAGSTAAALAELGPAAGYQVLSRTIERLCSYEFLGTDAPWKSIWTQTSRARLRVQAFAPTPVGRADRLVFSLGSRRPGRSCRSCAGERLRPR